MSGDNNNETVQVKMVGDYIVEDEIGSGSYSKVWSGYHKLTNLPVAIKAISQRKMKGDKKLKANLELEIKIMQGLKHPNVIRLYDVLTTEKHIYLILEYCSGGDLSKFRTSKGGAPLSESAILPFILQLCKRLFYINVN